MAFDFKKEMKDLYRPGAKPVLAEVPPAIFIAVCGHSDPNDEAGKYKRSIPLLYGITYAICMSEQGAQSAVAGRGRETFLHWLNCFDVESDGEIEARKKRRRRTLGVLEVHEPRA